MGLAGIGYEYENRRQFDNAADVWKELLEPKDYSSFLAELSQVAPSEISAEDADAFASLLVNQAKVSLSEIVDPRVSIDSSSIVAGTKTNLNVRYRNAAGADIVVWRLNLDEPMKMVRAEKFWQEYGELGALNGLVDTLLRRHFSPNERTAGSQQDAKSKELLNLLKDGGLVGDEVARYSVELESSPKRFDKMTRVDFPVDEPGAYLVEVTATGGNKDAAVVWLRDVAVKREPLEDGCLYLALDAHTGEPLANQTLEFFVVAQNLRDVPRATTTREYTKRTDATGSLFLPYDDVHTRRSLEVFVSVPKEDGGEANAAQCSFVGFQGIWRLYGGKLRLSKSEYVFPNLPARFVKDSSAHFLADQPVYRPSETAEFKFVVGGSDYDTLEEAMWAGQEVDYQTIGPRGDVLAAQRVTLDKHGAYRGSYKIPSDAEPGVYTVQIAQNVELRSVVDYSSEYGLLGTGSFEVQE